MRNLSAIGLVFLSLAVITTPVLAKTEFRVASRGESSAENQQQIVETVDIQGNRRLRDDDLLYYITTPPRWNETSENYFHLISSIRPRPGC